MVNQIHNTEITPQCAVYGQCGGCDYQHLSYADELIIKNQYVRTLFEEAFSLDPNFISSIVSSPEEYYYRHRLDFKFIKNRNDERLLGFTPAQKKGIIVVDTCHIAKKEIVDFIPKLKEESRNWPKEYRRANVVVRTGDDGRVLWGGVGKRSLRTDPKDYLWSEIHGRRIYYSMESFFQANLSILPKVFETLWSFPVWNKRVKFYDLYGGVGLFSLALFDRVKEVLLIEENIHAIKVAEHNKEYNQAANIQIVSGRVEDHLSKINPENKEDLHVAMIDPPRAGLGKDVSKALSQATGLDCLFYLSCHPESLINDLKILTQSIWSIERVIPFDFFPRTKHIETLVFLRNKSKG